MAIAMKYTYYISISKIDNIHHMIHNATCKVYLQNKEDMIPIGRHEQFSVALSIAKNNFKKVLPCSRCILKRRLYNIAHAMRGPTPLKHLSEE